MVLKNLFILQISFKKRSPPITSSSEFFEVIACILLEILREYHTLISKNWFVKFSFLQFNGKRTIKMENVKLKYQKLAMLWNFPIKDVHSKQTVHFIAMTQKESNFSQYYTLLLIISNNIRQDQLKFL